MFFILICIQLFCQKKWQLFESNITIRAFKFRDISLKGRRKGLGIYSPSSPKYTFIQSVWVGNVNNNSNRWVAPSPLIYLRHPSFKIGVRCSVRRKSVFKVYRVAGKKKASLTSWKVRLWRLFLFYPPFPPLLYVYSSSEVCVSSEVKWGKNETSSIVVALTNFGWTQKSPPEVSVRKSSIKSKGQSFSLVLKSGNRICISCCNQLDILLYSVIIKHYNNTRIKWEPDWKLKLLKPNTNKYRNVGTGAFLIF